MDNPNDNMIKEIMKRKDTLCGERSNWEFEWRDAVRFVYPQSKDFRTTEPKGDNYKQDRIYDSTASQACEDLAGTLHSHLTNSPQRWFSLKRSRKNKDVKSVQEGLDNARDIIFEDILTNPASKFSTAMHEFYLSFCAFGTGIIYVKRSDGMVRFRCVSLTECYISCNDDDIIDTLYRCYMMKAKNILAKFGDKIDGNLKEKMMDKPFEEYKIIHAVEPRNITDKMAEDNMNMPFRSVYILESEELLLEESGYKHFPYLVARWSRRAGEVYGRGPTSKGLPDIRMADKMKETIIKAAQLATLPAFQTTAGNFAKKKVRIKPGAILTVRNEGEMIKPIFDKVNPGIGFELLKDTLDSVKHAYSANLLGESDKKYMTATEIMDNKDKALLYLSAVVQRLEEECFKPLIDLCFYYLVEANEIILQDSNFKVQYVSPVMRAIRSADIMQYRRWVDLMAVQIQALPPEVVASINFRQIVKTSAEALDLPDEFIKDDEAFAEAMQQMQAQAESQMKVDDSQAIKNSAEAISTVQGASDGGQ